ncbi:pentatricopeptide repeat-containing protein At2g20540-like [Macadamia integrifolia]|uniref:pentatricopeptide repeat-containing protein At2g20540-like n=1 Tax=Macadamia integrifolia TaxID=60698 RepID=UPI001C4FBD9C|nr:pentatricopeptide repeat-containing protein At2g20540-like [Macadamia integrifolia]
MNRTNCHSLLQKCGNLEQLKQVHAQVITQGLHHLQHIACKILNNYTKFNKSVEAHKVFNQIKNPDIISWTCLISLYLQVDQPCKALAVFSELICTGHRPDSFSIVGALSACGRKQDLSHGKMVHGMIFRCDLGSDPIVGNAVIDMYSRNARIEAALLVFLDMEIKDVGSWTSMLHGYVKCNDLKSARLVFDKMPQRNSISWTAMISGYIRAGNPIQALELFQKMKSEGDDPPNATTIVAVLSACADIGALDLGRSIHSYISKTNLNSEDITLCNALLDMYSKSGILDWGAKIFHEMPKKDLFSWTTMISGFAFHGDGNSAIQVFCEMLRTGVSPNEVTFVALLSACSHAGLAEEGQRLFHRMSQIYGLEPKIEHYGCMVDLLARAGLVEEAEKLIGEMQTDPDAVIWRSLLSACLVQGNVKLAQMAGKKVIELESEDDGVYVLLGNMYCSANRREEALKTRKMMKDQNVKKKPGCSWIEVNGVVHEFVAGAKMHCLHTDIYFILEGIAKQLKLGSSRYRYEYDG